MVKRHGFHGAPASHGTKHALREPGSIGATWPQRVIKGMRMAGRMGGVRVSTKGLKIAKVDVIKMDIEGAEIEAIQGAEETLKRNYAYVAIASYHIVNGKTTSIFLENYLSKIGYKAKSDFPKHLTTYGKKESF